ncbi:MAG TPA: methyltransferase domain-containing protein [Gemmatimonadaceae bacterium]|nr:methyltransferase domain-containing protein [Gemmatimonadaceae bacterium]
MLPLLTPPRRRGVEYLDTDVEPGVRRRSHRDIALSNRLFGGVHAVRAALEPLLARGPRELSLLDVGTGTGDIPSRLVPVAARRGVRLRILGLDGHRELVAATREWRIDPVCADALSLPFADRSIDVVCCSQVLHHFEPRDALRLLREMHRVANECVIVADLRRSWVAAAALWLISFPLGFHPVSRHDGVVSIFRGFTGAELRALVREAVGVDARVRRRFLFRVTASWPRDPAAGAS